MSVTVVSAHEVNERNVYPDATVFYIDDKNGHLFIGQIAPDSPGSEGLGIIHAIYPPCTWSRVFDTDKEQVY